MSGTRRLAVGGAAAVALWLVAATGPVAASHDFTLTPTSGPPGTTVDIRFTTGIGGADYVVYWDFVTPVNRGTLVATGSGNGPTSFTVRVGAAAGAHLVGVCLNCTASLPHFVVHQFTVPGVTRSPTPSPVRTATLTPSPTPAPSVTAPPTESTPAGTPTGTPTVAPSATPGATSPAPSPSRTTNRTPVVIAPDDDPGGGGDGGTSPIVIVGSVFLGAAALGGLGVLFVLVRSRGGWRAPPRR